MISATMRPIVLLSVVIACAAFPAGAAAKTFTGKSGQAKPVTLRTDAGGVAVFVRIPWTASCRRGGTFRDRTDFGGKLDQASAESVGDHGTYTARERGGIRARISVRLQGRHQADPADPSADMWTGTLSATVTVRRRGKRIDRCTLKPTHWTVRPA